MNEQPSAALAALREAIRAAAAGKRALIDNIVALTRLAEAACARWTLDAATIVFEAVHPRWSYVRLGEDGYVVEAAEKYRYMNNPGSYVGPYDSSITPYLRKPQNMLTSLDHTGIVFVGPAQAAKTEWELTLGEAASFFVVGRGLGFAIASEAALKLKEVLGLHAEAYSSAEVLHGPVTLSKSWISPGEPSSSARAVGLLTTTGRRRDCTGTRGNTSRASPSPWNLM